MRLTCTLRQWGARADVDVVYPDVPSGAVHKVTLHHNLPQPKKRKDEEEEEEGKVEEKRSERKRKTDDRMGGGGTLKMGTAARGEIG